MHFKNFLLLLVAICTNLVGSANASLEIKDDSDPAVVIWIIGCCILVIAMIIGVFVACRYRDGAKRQCKGCRNPTCSTDRKTSVVDEDSTSEMDLELGHEVKEGH